MIRSFALLLAASVPFFPAVPADAQVQTLPGDTPRQLASSFLTPGPGSQIGATTRDLVSSEVNPGSWLTTQGGAVIVEVITPTL